MSANQGQGPEAAATCSLEVDVDGRIQVVNLTREVTTLGDGPRCHVRVPGVSEEQAELRKTPHGLILANVGDPQLVSVNGRSVLTEALLKDGDRMRCGAFDFKVRLGSGEPEARQGSSEPSESESLSSSSRVLASYAIIDLDLIPKRRQSEILDQTREQRWSGGELADAILDAYGWDERREQGLVQKTVRRLGTRLAESVEGEAWLYRVKLFFARSLGRTIFVLIVIVLVLASLVYLERTVGWNLYEGFDELLGSL